MTKTHLWCAALASVLAVTSGAAAQNLNEPYLGVGLMLGFAGEATIESASAGGVTVTPSQEPEADLELGIGGGVQYIFPLHRYVALGGKLAVLTWRTDLEGDGGRNLAFDLAVVPQLRVPVMSAVELYLSVPIGLTLDLLNEFDSDGVVGRFEADPGFGFNVAALVGARFAFNLDVGMFVELGYSLHSVTHDVSASIGGPGVTVEFDVSWWQLALNAGVYF